MTSGRDTVFTVWIFVRRDVPLTDATQRLRAAGVIPRTTSRWLYAVSASVPAQALVALGRERWIGRIQPLGRWRRSAQPNRIDEWTVLAGDTCAAGGDPTYGASEMPYRQLHLRPLADAGVNGSGVRIAILDAGFNTQDPVFAGVTLTAQHDFVFGDSVVRDEPNDQPGAQFHGTAVWSLFAGLVPGRLVGIARGASFLLAKTEDIRSETRVEEDNYVAALEWADSIGVDIVSSSLGYLSFDNGFSYTPSQLNGDVAVTSVAADSAAARGILVVTAAGNEGPGFRTLVTPGDAHSVITAGAEDSLGTITGFSSRGPTADGRLKPDLTAPGLDVCTDAGGSLGRLAGTSFSTPLLAASAALLKQLHPTLSPLAMRDALRAHASNHATPDSIRGWGRPDVTAAATFADGVTPLEPLPPTLASITPDFAWSVGAIPGFAQPVTYRLRIARDSAFATVVVDTQLSIAQYPLRQPETRCPAVLARGGDQCDGGVGVDRRRGADRRSRLGAAHLAGGYRWIVDAGHTTHVHLVAHAGREPARSVSLRRVRVPHREPDPGVRRGRADRHHVSDPAAARAQRDLPLGADRSRRSGYVPHCRAAAVRDPRSRRAAGDAAVSELPQSLPLRHAGGDMHLVRPRHREPGGARRPDAARRYRPSRAAQLERPGHSGTRPLRPRHHRRESL